MKQWEMRKTEVLIIGGGGAGVRAAFAVNDAGRKATLAVKGAVSHCGLTPMAYPSIQAAMGYEDQRDNAEVHYADIIENGRGLSDQDLARALADDSVARVEDLVSYGVPFELRENGKLMQVQHPGETYPRNMVLKSGGAGMMHALRRELKRRSEIEVLEDFDVTKILVSDGKVAGACGIDMRTGNLVCIQADAVVAATGGYEAMWEHTDVAPDSTGDGLMLAYRAGARLIDLEMILYYPFITCGASGRGILIQYESLVHAHKLGGKMLDANGKDLLPGGDPPPRDEMMRIMSEAVENGGGGPNGGVFVDLTKSPLSKEEIDRMVTTLFNIPPKNLTLQGIDFDSGVVEVKPGLHYALGGIRIDAAGRTNLPGLFAGGECDSNLHGANRISGNALAETQVFGCRAGNSAAEYVAKGNAGGEIKASDLEDEAERIEAYLAPKACPVRPVELKKKLTHVMEQFVGVRRSEDGLKEALSKVEEIEKQLPNVTGGSKIGIYNYELATAMELENMIELAKLVIESASMRKETRGHHIRTDYPRQDPAWSKHTMVEIGKEISTLPVVRL